MELLKRKIDAFLAAWKQDLKRKPLIAKTSKKFQITKVARGARNREYIGAVEWLEKAGVVNVCYCLNAPALHWARNQLCICLLQIILRHYPIMIQQYHILSLLT